MHAVPSFRTSAASGGRVLTAATREVKSRAAYALCMAAQSLQRSQSALGDYVRRFKGRLGKAEGITAGAHSRAERDSLREAQPEGCRRRAAATWRGSSGH